MKELLCGLSFLAVLFCNITSFSQAPLLSIYPGLSDSNKKNQNSKKLHPNYYEN